MVWAAEQENPEPPPPPAAELLPAFGAELGRMPTSLAELQRSVRGLPIGERVAALSQPWMGRPYTNGPLGEWIPPDSDPVIRYDTFDCLTFIEEVFALALAPDPGSVQSVRMGLRYRNNGPWTYENRRHFMLAEWIPGVTEDGWFEDITRNFEGTVQVEREVTPAAWAGWWGRSALMLSDERLPVGHQSFAYLPLDQALAQLNDIPAGSVIFFVRQPVDSIPIAITHVGMSIPGATPTLRHASKAAGKITDEPLSSYIERQRAWAKWPMVGVILLKAIDFGPRAFMIKDGGSAAPG